MEGQAPTQEDQNGSQGQCALCSAPSHLRCSNCAGGVYYCSKEHQKDDWKEHKRQCDPLKIVSHPQYEGQKVLIATRDIKKGEVFLKEKPFICGPRVHTSFEISSMQQMPKDLSKFPVCLGCLRVVPASVKYKCSKCFWPVCSAICEKEAFHADFECKIFAEYSIPPLKIDKVHDYISICLLRMLLLRELNPKVWDKCLQMKGFWEGRELRTLGPDLALQHSLTDAFLRRCRVQVEPEVLDRVTRVYYGNRRGILALASDVQLPDYRQGSFLYLKNSFAVQSCLPSSCWITHCFKKGTEIHGRAHFDIPKGSPITIASVIPLKTTTMRQMMLQNMNWLCSCDRCRDPTELGTYYQAVKCKKCKDGYLLPKEPLVLNTSWVCDKKECAFTCSGENARLMTAEVEKDRQVELMAFNQQILMPSLLEDSIVKHEGVTVHPNHSLLLEMKFDLLERIEFAIGPNYPVVNRKDDTAPPELRRKLIIRAKEALAVLDIINPGSTRNKGNFLYHMQLHMLHLLTLEVNGKKNLSDKDKERLRKDFEELVSVRKEGLFILDFEVAGSPEKARAKELKKEPPQFEMIRRVLEI